MEWQGGAKELQEYMYMLYERHPDDEVTLTVNASPETATFLQVRHTMMQQAEQSELI